MFSLLRSDAGNVFKKAKRKGLTHFEKNHRLRAMLYFKRAAQARPARACELAQFYYDNHDYKRATWFYDLMIRNGGAPKSAYRYAIKAYEKRAAIYNEEKAYQKFNACRAQALAYRASVKKRFGPPPMPANLVADA